MTTESKKWVNYPIRMITGWSAEWCVLCAVLDNKGNIVEFNDSEDILWFRHNRMPWSIDAGWYRDRFVVYFLVGEPSDTVSWDSCIVARKETQTPLEMIQCVEQWMSIPPILAG